MKLTEETAKRLAEALEESTKQDRIIQAQEYYSQCMREDGRFALSPDQRKTYKSILNGTYKPWSGDYL